jgi:hypothetical protein
MRWLYRIKVQSINGSALLIHGVAVVPRNVADFSAAKTLLIIPWSGQAIGKTWPNA